jgi:hypothetical protein
VWGGAVLPSPPHQPTKGPWWGEGRNLTVLPVSPLVEITPLRGSRGGGVCSCWLAVSGDGVHVLLPGKTAAN